MNVSRQSGDAFPVGATTVEASAIDLSGNEARCSFTVQVVASVAATDSGASASVLGGAGAAGAVLLLLLVVAVLALRRAQRRARQPQNWDEIFALLDQFKNREGGEDGTGPRYPREIRRDAVKLLGELGTGLTNYAGDDPDVHPVSRYWRPQDDDIPLQAWAQNRRDKG